MLDSLFYAGKSFKCFFLSLKFLNNNEVCMYWGGHVTAWWLVSHLLNQLKPLLQRELAVEILVTSR